MHLGPDHLFLARSAFGDWDLGHRIWGFGLGIQDLGVRTYGLGFRIQGLGFSLGL